LFVCVFVSLLVWFIGGLVRWCGLLVAVDPDAAVKVEAVLEAAGVRTACIGCFNEDQEGIRCLKAVPSAST
jgi:hypothetical protein